jgi:hypothetical protein
MINGDLGVENGPVRSGLRVLTRHLLPELLSRLSTTSRRVVPRVLAKVRGKDDVAAVQRYNELFSRVSLDGVLFLDGVGGYGRLDLALLDTGLYWGQIESLECSNELIHLGRSILIEAFCIRPLGHAVMPGHLKLKLGQREDGRRRGQTDALGGTGLQDLVDALALRGFSLDCILDCREEEKAVLPRENEAGLGDLGGRISAVDRLLWENSVLV